MQSKARRNQLNLPHGTKTKLDMLENGDQPESIVSIRKERGPMVGRICERGRFKAESERMEELWMMRVVNLWKGLNWNS